MKKKKSSIPTVHKSYLVYVNIEKKALEKWLKERADKKCLMRIDIKDATNEK